jgi:hypothetical protein
MMPGHGGSRSQIEGLRCLRGDRRAHRPLQTPGAQCDGRSSARPGCPTSGSALWHREIDDHGPIRSRRAPVASVRMGDGTRIVVNNGSFRRGLHYRQTVLAAMVCPRQTLVCVRAPTATRNALELLAEMANESDVNVLARGVQDWNKWRADNPRLRPNLEELTLTRSEFPSIDLRGCSLRGADFGGSNLLGADFSSPTRPSGDGMGISRAVTTAGYCSFANAVLY